MRIRGMSYFSQDQGPCPTRKKQAMHAATAAGLVGFTLLQKVLGRVLMVSEFQDTLPACS